MTRSQVTLARHGGVPIRVKKRNGAFFRLVKCTISRPPARAATRGMCHGKGIRKPAGTHEVKPASLGELIHEDVRVTIETAVQEELRATLGATPYERSETRRGWSCC